MNGQAILTLALQGGFLLVFTLLVIAFYVRRTVRVTISGFSWSRKVRLEHSVWVQAASYHGFPAGSRNQHMEDERYQSSEYSHDEITTTSGTDGQVFTTAQPVFHSVTRLRTKYTYESQQWITSRELLAEGKERATLHWPAYLLDRSTQERVLRTQEQYLVCFQTARGKTYQRKLPLTDWAALDDKSTYLLKVNLYGYIMNRPLSQIAEVPKHTS